MVFFSRLRTYRRIPALYSVSIELLLHFEPQILSGKEALHSGTSQSEDRIVLLIADHIARANYSFFPTPEPQRTPLGPSPELRRPILAKI